MVAAMAAYGAKTIEFQPYENLTIHAIFSGSELAHEDWFRTTT